MVDNIKHKLILFLTLTLPFAVFAQSLQDRLDTLYQGIRQSATLFYLSHGADFLLWFFLMLFILLVPSLFKKTSGQLLFWLSMLCFVLWIGLPRLLPLLNIAPSAPYWVEIARNLCLLGSLILFFSYYSKNFTKGWILATAIPFCILSFLIFLWIILPQVYNLFPLALIRNINNAIELPLYSILIAVFYLFMLIRLIVALVGEEAFRGWAVLILGAGLAISLTQFLRQDLSLGIPSNNALALDYLYLKEAMAVMLFIGVSRAFIPVKTEKTANREPEKERLYRELEDKKQTLDKLQKELSDEDVMLGKVIRKSRKLRETLLPPVIHPDKFWEASVYYHPENSEQPDYYDFFYGPGRNLKGGVFFDIQNGMNGSFMGSWLKSTLAAEFVDSSSLCTLYRSLYKGTEEFREGGELLGQMVKLKANEIEYTGWRNAPMLFRSEEKQRAASMIQDPVNHQENIKSYRIQVIPGDALLMTSDNFYDLPHGITDEPYGVMRAVESFTKQEGKATDMLKGLMQDRMKYYGDSRINRGVFMLVIRRKP